LYSKATQDLIHAMITA